MCTVVSEVSFFLGNPVESAYDVTLSSIISDVIYGVTQLKPWFMGLTHGSTWSYCIMFCSDYFGVEVAAPILSSHVYHQIPKQRIKLLSSLVNIFIIEIQGN